jgi:hypothetical protein
MWKATWEGAQKAAARVGDVHIHNHTENHFHGGEEDQHKRLATAHRKHVENLRKDIQEAVYQDNRRAFA